MVLKFAREGTGWGASRIHGELMKLGVRISDAKVRRILIENGFEPGPERGDATWKEFLKRHKDTLWACDFFTKNVVTKGGIVTFYVLFFIHIRSRRVHVAGMTPAPNSEWMAQQARNLSMYLANQGDAKPTHIVRDRGLEVHRAILRHRRERWHRIQTNPAALAELEPIRRTLDSEH